MDLINMANHEPGDEVVQHSLLLDAADVSEDASDPQPALAEPGTAIATLVPEARAELPTSVVGQGAGSITSFDYSKVSKAIASEMRATVVRIRDRTEKDYIATGADLTRIKEKLHHGQWLPWVRAEFWFSISTAERMMGWAALAKTNSSAVTNLGPGVINAIAPKSTPREIRDRVLAAAEAGETQSAKAVRREIRQHREKKRKEATHQQALIPAQSTGEAQLEEERQVEEDQRRRENEQHRRSAELIVELLVEQVDSLPWLVELIEASDIKHSMITKLLREHLATTTPPPSLHVPPPPRRPALATPTRHGEILQPSPSHLDGGEGQEEPVLVDDGSG
jgi:hypothetical protein